jgi:hypothetical protein
MKAIGVNPGRAGSIQLQDVPKPSVDGDRKAELNAIKVFVEVNGNK